MLILGGTSPDCAFWNLCLWNQLLHTYDHTYDRVTINGAQVVYEPDGSWEIAISASDPGHPNWVSTQGHETGRICFRWFLPSHTPVRPTPEVRKILCYRIRYAGCQTPSRGSAGRRAEPAHAGRPVRVPQPLISAVENGRRQPGADLLLRLIAATGHDVVLSDTVAASREAAAKLEQVVALASALPVRKKGPLAFPAWPR